MGYLFEVLSGTIDGVNDTFTFSEAYTPGTAALYLNGQLMFHTSTTPWVESDPTTGEVTMIPGCEPRPGDVLSGFALDTAPPALETISDLIICATIGEKDGLRCAIFDQDVLTGRVADAKISGTVVEDDSIIGRIGEENLTGTTSEC